MPKLDVWWRGDYLRVNPWSGTLWRALPALSRCRAVLDIACRYGGVSVEFGFLFADRLGKCAWIPGLACALVRARCHGAPAGAALTAYAVEVHLADFNAPGGDDVVEKITANLQRAGLPARPSEVRERLVAHHRQALTQTHATD